MVPIYLHAALIILLAASSMYILAVAGKAFGQGSKSLTLEQGESSNGTTNAIWITEILEFMMLEPLRGRSKRLETVLEIQSSSTDGFSFDQNLFSWSIHFCLHSCNFVNEWKLSGRFRQPRSFSSALLAPAILTEEITLCRKGDA